MIWRVCLVNRQQVGAWLYLATMVFGPMEPYSNGVLQPKCIRYRQPDVSGHRCLLHAASRICALLRLL